MEGAKNSVLSKNSMSPDPMVVLEEAYEYAKDVIGSSTACVVALNGNTLRGANLGKDFY